MVRGAETRRPEGILLVEDDRGSALAMEAALAELGERVVTAFSGDEALRILFEHDFALALLDVHMPGLDGLQTAQLIRSRRRTSQLPIIFVTGDASSHARMVDAYELGAIDFLIKPIVPAVVRAKARTLLELQHQAFELAVREEQRRLVDELSLRVAERAAAQRALERANARLRRIDRRKDDFLALLAHELRSPLASISFGVTLLLQCDPTPENVRDVAPRMDRQLRVLLRLLGDLSDVAGIRAGKVEVRRTPLDLRLAIEDAVEASRADVERGSHRLTVRMCEHPLMIEGDHDRLTQVFTNLLTNAARHMDAGGRIELTVRRESEALVVVSDTGHGIAEDGLDAVFEAYEQLNEHTGVGFGLGLYLVRRLVERHRGRAQRRPGSREPLRGADPAGGSRWRLLDPRLNAADRGGLRNDREMLVLRNARTCALALSIKLT